MLYKLLRPGRFLQTAGNGTSGSRREIGPDRPEDCLIDFARQIQVGSITINSLPPTSRQPLVVRPFKPASAFVQSLPLLHSAKGKAKESTSDVDYALLEGLVVAATVRHDCHPTCTDTTDPPDCRSWKAGLQGQLI